MFPFVSELSRDFVEFFLVDCVVCMPYAEAHVSYIFNSCVEGFCRQVNVRV